jgi:WD40 repeat protein
LSWIRTSPSPAGRWLAAVGERGTLVLFDAESGELVKRLEGHNPDAPDFGSIEGGVFDPTGKWLFSSGSDGRIIRWSVPDGRTLATAGYDGRVGLFDVESGEGELFETHDGKVANVAFSRDGKELLSAGIEDFKLRLWDLTKQPPEPRDIAKAQDELLWATLRPDDRQLAAVGADETVRLWDLETHKELFALRLPDLQQSEGPWDFDFRCTDPGECWIAVPLTMGRIVLYRLPYDHPPKSLTNP